MDNISENKSRVGSIVVPYDREYPEVEPVKASQIVIHFYVCGRPSKLENAKRGTKGSK
jgi:hypothetical protein